MPEKSQLPAIYRDYIGKYKAMALSTVDEAGRPDCSTVYFASNSQGELFFASDNKTTKSQNLAANPHCAVAMSDGGTSAMGVKLFGVAQALTEPEEIREATEVILERIPSIQGFFDNPDLVVYHLVPERKYVINFSWGIDWKLEVE